MQIGSAIFTVEARDTDFSKTLTEAGKKAQALGSTLASVGSKMVTAGSKISTGLLPITSAITDIAKASIDAASSTEESLNKVRVVFGKSAVDIEAWAVDSARNLGISRQKALEAAGTFGNLFTAMGLGRPQAAGLSMDIVKLAADLASFNNIKPEEALEKLRAGLIGEAEPLRTLGVNLSVAAMEAYAMKNGIGAAGKELTDSEKIMARFGLITEQTKNAQGDFKNTSDGLANSLRIQKAEQENVQAQLGAALIPVMQEVTKIITGVMTAFASLSPEMQKIVIIGGGILLVLGPLLTAVGVLVTVLGFVATAFGAVSITAAGASIAIGTTTIVLGPLLLVVGAVALAIGLLWLAWQTNFMDIQGKTAEVVGFVTRLFQDFVSFFTSLWQGLPGPVQSAIAAITAPISGLISLAQTAIGWLSQLTGARSTANFSTQNHAAGGNYGGGMTVGSYAAGTPFVPRTGLALVHEGERIIPASENRGRSSDFARDVGGSVTNVYIDSQLIESIVSRRQNTDRRIRSGGAA